MIEEKNQNEQDVVKAVKDNNLIVSASAGSGKTTVMIDCILNHLLRQDCHLDEMLVLTYTKASAIDMKKKLIKKIKENITTNQFLQDELELVQTSDISTFDSFCQKLVKRYFFLCGVDPAFSILGEADIEYYQNKAMKKSLAKLKKEYESEYEFLLYALSQHRNENEIIEIVFKIYNYITSLADKDGFFEQTKMLYDKNKRITEQMLLTEYKEVIKEYKYSFEELLKKSVDYGYVDFAKFLNAVLSILDSAYLQSDLQSFVQELSKKLPSKPSVKKDNVVLVDDGVKNELEGLKKFIEKLKSLGDLSDLEKAYEKCGKLIDNILLLTQIFMDTYFSIKQKINMYDFTDLQQFAIQILENQEVNEEIKEQYKYVFVDEFQDANKIQERIVRLLDNGKNLFFVGDTKQAIYGFRQSNPQIFLDIVEEFKNREFCQALMLNCNYRTNKNILDFANDIFSKIMTKKTCGLDYKNSSIFISRAPYEDLENEVCVEVDAILQEKENKTTTNPDKVYSVKEHSVTDKKENKYKKESMFICQRILSLLGTEIYDKELKQKVKIEYKDIVILVLKRGKFLTQLLNDFKEIGIPFVADTNEKLEECYDATVLYSLLKISQNFKDDYSLYAVLTSELFNFSNEELGLIKSENIDEKYFYDCLKKYDKNDEIGQKIAKFMQKLKDFAFNVTYFGIFYAFNKILVETEYLLKMANQDDYLERKNNTISYVNSFANSKFDRDIGAYLLSRETVVGDARISQEKTFVNAITITTIHSSKGLEFPVVILPFMSENFTKKNSGNLSINSKLGIGIKFFDEDERIKNAGMFYTLCAMYNQKEEMSERIRLLYVAITRPKNKLIITGQVDCCKMLQTDFSIINQNDFMSLIVGCLDNVTIEKINNGKTFSTDLFKNKRNILNVCKVEIEKVKKNKSINKKNCEEDVIKLNEFLNSNKVTEQNSQIAFKNSVSSLLLDENSSHNFAPKSLNISEHLQEKANDIGTLYHSILEKIDFSQVHNEQNVKDFVIANYDNSQIEQIEKLGVDNIYNNICLIKNFIDKDDKILKEQKFVMKVPYNKVVNSNITDMVLVQGVIDLLIIKKDKTILFDYKFTNKNKENIIQTYQKQLDLYSLAVEKMFVNMPTQRYILSLKNKEIITI